MEPFAVYTLTSPLHDERSIARISDDFLSALWPEGGYRFRDGDFSDFGTCPLSLIFVRTGGTEGLFKQLLPELLGRSEGRFFLLTSGKSNSLAASMEILSYLRQQGLSGEIIHGSPEHIRRRVETLRKVGQARRQLSTSRLGIIGQPSDWLIASDYDTEAILGRLGVRLQEIPMQALLDAFAVTRFEESIPETLLTPGLRAAYPDAIRIYSALRMIVEKEGLSGLTLRCFDLLTALSNTGCLALARLNAEGIPAGCEGDVPSLLSMVVAHAATGMTGFQANPSRINPDTGELLFAHCTIALNLVDDYRFDTHYESGIGVGICGHFPAGPVTVYKLSGDLKRRFLAEGELVAHPCEADLCRTQVLVRLAPQDARRLLTDPIGNHHILIPGHHAALLEEIV